eukprot:1837967-Rhodomonas_salina.1
MSPLFSLFRTSGLPPKRRNSPAHGEIKRNSPRLPHTLYQDRGERRLTSRCRCPITCELMEDPVLAMDGHSYERKAIED